MNITKRDFLILAPAAALAATPALALRDSVGDERLMVAHAKYKAAHLAWKAARDPVDRIEAAVFDEARARFGEVEDRGDIFQDAAAWVWREKNARGFNSLEAEADRLLSMEDEALLAFYETPAYTAEGLLLKATVAGNLGDYDQVYDSLVVDIERLAGAA